jgi:membrane-bound lytic murein transglycosylase C
MTMLRRTYRDRKPTLRYVPILTAALLFVCIASATHAQQSYADYVRDIEAQWDAYDQQQQFEAFQRQQDSAFQQFQQDQDDAFQRFRDDIQAKWNEFLEPTPEQWVDYDEEGDTRITVNFEETVEEDDGHGQITVETLIEVDAGDGPEIPEEAIQQIAEQIEALVSEENATGQALLEDQIQTAGGEVVTPENVQEYVTEEIADIVRVDPEPIESADGVERIRISVVVPLVPNHLRVRAEKFLPIVQKWGAENTAAVPLTMSIIQTESYFNPRAKSHIPAYGLMQLVPSSGGRDAYREVFKEDKAPTPEFLYIPDNNVRLGTAYYHVIRDRYLYGVEDAEKKELLAIAAYNGGIGRVIKRVMKKHDVPGMTTEALYDALRKAMPEETADYLEKVTSRKDNYLEWEEP